MGRPVVHFEIGGRDVAKLRAFYTELFGWSIDSRDPSYGLVAEQAPGIGGGIMQLREDMQPYVTVYVLVDDLSDALAQAERLGGAVVVRPTPLPDVGSFALFQDPEGHMIGLFTAA